MINDVYVSDVIKILACSDNGRTIVIVHCKNERKFIEEEEENNDNKKKKIRRRKRKEEEEDEKEE